MKTNSKILHTLVGKWNKPRVRMAARACAFVILFVCFSVNALGQINIYMKSFDTNRTEANLNETTLTPANVNPNSFGKLWTVPTDGQIFTQPLYISNLQIAGGKHNVVFVGTMRDTIYAVDADSGTILWSRNFGTPIIAAEVENDDNVVRANDGTIGILGTPVIDPDRNYMYFVSGEQPGNPQDLYYNLNAIDITDGSPVLGSPVKISATYKTADLGKAIVFDAELQNARTGLVLSQGNIYICFSSHEDQDPYYGWVMSYNASTLAQVAVYADTTLGTYVHGYQFTGGWGGIWMAGQAPAVDSDGNLYMSSGNGSYGTTPSGVVQTGNSFMKLSPDLKLLDYFTPYNSSDLNNNDGDLGSGGLLLIPDTNYVLGGGKQGVLYLANTSGNMGGFNSSGDQVRQEFQAVMGNGTSHIHGSPAYYNSPDRGPSVYVWGENDVLRAFTFNTTTGMVNTNPFAKSTMTAPVTNNFSAMPGGFLSISANGSKDAVLWASTPYSADASKQLTQGVLYAFDPTNLTLLWSDKINDGRDEIGIFAKFLPPIVANGKMYVPNFGTSTNATQSGNLLCYGLLGPQITVNVADATMPAGSTVPMLTGTVNGLQNGDTVGTTIYVTYSTTATSTSPAGTYPIIATVTGSSAGNYGITVDAGTLTVTFVQKPVLTVSANDASRAYNTANPAFTGTVTGAQNGDTFTESFSTTATTASNVGSYRIVPAASGANLNNYTVQTNNGTLTITQAAQTISFPGIASPVYGGPPSVVSATSSAGTNYPVTITVESGPATISGGTMTVTGPGMVVLLASQAGDANYSAATATQSVPVTAARLTVTANNATRVYNTANPAFTGTVNGAQNGDTFSESFSTVATTTSNVGSYLIVPTASGSDLSDYAVTTNNGALTITQATQTLSFPAIAAHAYGSAPFAVAATSSAGSNYPVTITVQSGPATVAGGTVNITGAGTVLLLASQAGDLNYSAATATQTFMVTAAQLTATANNATRVYNTANPAFSGTITGALGSDTFTESFTTTATAASNVGSYPIVPAVSGAQLAGYTVNVVNGAMTVTAAPTTTTLHAPTTASVGASVLVSATVSSTAGTPGGVVTFYSGTTALGTAALDGRGVAMLSTTAQATGTETLTASYPATGNFSGSTSAPSDVTFSAASQTITFPAIGAHAYGSAPFAVSATSSLGSSYPVTIRVQSGPATISGGIVTVNAVGTVVLLATQAGDAKQSPATATQSFQVTPAALSVTAANATRAFGAANPTFTGTVIGAVGTDIFSETFSTAATPSSNAGSYPIVPAVTGPVDNYTVTTTNGALTITAAPVLTPTSYAVAASPAALTVQLGKSVNTMLTVTPSGSYGGTISLSCTNLPANANCAFAQNSVTLTGNNQTATVSLIINTTMQSAGMRSLQSPALLALAFWWPGGLTGLVVFARKRQSKMPRWAQLCLLLLCTCAFAIGLSGCGMSGLAGGQTTSQVTVVATGISASGVTTQNVVLSLTVLQ